MTEKKENPDSLGDLRALLAKLALTTLAKEIGELLSRAESSHLSYSEFLARALEVEEAARWERKVQRLVRWSKLGPYVSLDGFNFALRPELEPQVVKELITGRFIKEHRNALLVGRSSTGKTRIARSIGHAACRLGISVYYVSLAEMLGALHASRADNTYRKAFRRVVQPELLILEDCGFDTGLGHEGANELFKVVSARYHERATLVVTNLPFRQWGDFLPSPAQAVAIVDRLIHDATILRFSGEPFRKPKEIVGAPLDGE